MLRRDTYPIPPLEILAQFHPQFALAIWEGVPARPNERILGPAEFATNAVGVFEDASFDEQIDSYSVFTGADFTIDPNPTIASGNPLQGLSNVTQELVSGITATLLVRGRGDDYSPIPVDCPLQLVPAVLQRSAGAWHMNSPETARARFTIQASTITAPFSVWLVLSFLQLGSQGDQYLCMTRADAQARLRAAGILCPCPTGAPAPGA